MKFHFLYIFYFFDLILFSCQNSDLEKKLIIREHELTKKEQAFENRKTKDDSITKKYLEITKTIERKFQNQDKSISEHFDIMVLNFGSPTEKKTISDWIYNAWGGKKREFEKEEQKKQSYHEEHLENGFERKTEFVEPQRKQKIYIRINYKTFTIEKIKSDSFLANLNCKVCYENFRGDTKTECFYAVLPVIYNSEGLITSITFPIPVEKF